VIQNRQWYAAPVEQHRRKANRPMPLRLRKDPVMNALLRMIVHYCVMLTIVWLVLALKLRRYWC
jgi:uncharacterized protein (DUF3084 family)